MPQFIVLADVSFVDCTVLSSASPGLLPQVLPDDLTPASFIGSPSFWLAIPTRLAAGNHGASQLPDSSLVPCHALGPRQAFGSLTFAAALCRLPTSLTGSPPAFIFFVTGLDCFRETRPPLRPGTFPVYASTMPFASAPYNFSRVILLPCIAARLGTSDRLHLARRGLAPRKKSQTYAGALTTKAEPRRPICQPRMRNRQRDRRRLRRIVRCHIVVNILMPRQQAREHAEGCPCDYRSRLHTKKLRIQPSNRSCPTIV